MKRLLNKNEFILFLTIVVLSVVIGLINPSFFSLANLFDLMRSSIVMGIFAVGVLIVIISGGIDVSFTAIAAFAMYLTTKILIGVDFQGTVVVALLLGGLIGILLGLINAVFISSFKLPTLIVTLGTQSMYRGFLLAFIGSAYIIDIPAGMINLSKMNLFTVTTKDGAAFSLPLAIVLLVIVIIFSWFLLKYTMLGRGIYAMGGDMVAAERAGFNIKAIQFFIYGYVGFLSGLAGIVHSSLARMANPFDLVGSELNVIAAVVLGGARITGGHGTVLGAMLGVLLINIINNSLILLGVPSYWQKVVVGSLIIIGVAIPTFQQRNDRVLMNHVD